MVKDITTITIAVDTWKELSSLKTKPSETYDDVIKRLILDDE